MIDKNKEALKQQPLFQEEKINEQKDLHMNPILAQPLNVIREADEELEEDNDYEDELRDQVAELAEEEAKPFKQEMEKKENSRQGIGAAFKARRKELSEEAKQAREADKARNRELSKSAYNDLLASMTASAEMDKDEFRRFVMSPDIQKLKSEHKIKTRTRVIKHTLKADEEITERIVENKKEKVETKKENAQMLSENETMVKDAMINLRDSVDIKDKKGMTYTDFEEMSVFGMSMKDGGLSQLAHLYGEGERVKKGNSTLTRKETTFAAMNMMTAEIMKLDESAYDVHTDEALVKQSGELSRMSLMVRAYQKFLSKNPDYIDYLSKEKTQNGFLADQMYTKLERLSAIGQYYRIRKTVLEDPYYIEHANEEIPLTEEMGDSTQVRRLKKMMLASAQASSNLQNIFGGAKVPNIRLKSGKHADLLRSLTMKQVTDLTKVNEDERAAHIKLALNSIASANDAIRQLESETFFQAPMWIQNALTLDPEKIREKKLDKDYGLSSFLSQSVELYLPKLMETVGCEQEVISKDVLADLHGLKKKYGHLGEAYNKRWAKEKGPVKPMASDYVWNSSGPAFHGATDKEMGKLTLSDNWHRLEDAFSGVYAYKRTTAEVHEMIEHLKIQENEEEWDKAKNDKEARAFYESQYKEAARKLLFSEYAASRRLNETICLKMLALHPTDLLYQASPGLHSVILQSAVVTNSFTPSQEATIKRLFSEDMNGNYAFEADEVFDHCNMVSSSNIKLTYLMSHLCEILTGAAAPYQDICRKLYGDGDIYHHKILPAYQQAKSENEPLAMAASEQKENEIAWWYLSKHPEMLDRKYLHKKSGGRYILQCLLNSPTTTMIGGAEQALRDGLKHNIVDIPTDEEFAKYQDYMQKEGYPKIRTEKTISLDDEEGVIEEEIDPQMVIHLPGCATKVLTGAEIVKNRREDPYNLELIKNKFEELTYMDDTGKERVKNVLQVF